jgi:hypothetical protein
MFTQNIAPGKVLEFPCRGGDLELTGDLRRGLGIEMTLRFHMPSPSVHADNRIVPF